MKDLTQGSIRRHLAALAVPMGAGMLLQTLYWFVDLYFVSQLGDAAIAGVSAAGNLLFVVFFLTQMLAVGSVTMVSHAVGRKDRGEANHVFNQSVAIGALCALLTVAGGYAFAGPYMGFFGADEATRAAGVTFMRWFIPSLALQFAIVVLSSGLRGTGIVKPAAFVQALTVILNVILAPVLIAGWGTGKPLGVAGAGLATTLSVSVGVLVLVAYFIRLEHYVRLEPAQWKPRFATWARMLNIGLPAGGEFGLMAVFVAVIYWAARDSGAAAQAGIGVGLRTNQMILVPALAVAFAAAPIAGQNFGARNALRVRETFQVAIQYGAAVMVAITALVQWKSEALARVFTTDPRVVAVAAELLRYLSWNFIPAVVTMTCSSLFQSMGNAWPSLGSSAVRIVTFMFPAIWIARQPWFELRYLFMLSVATVFLHAVVSYAWLRSEMRKRLPAGGPDPEIRQFA
jgi:putative MATE family efflux protein